MLLAPPDAPVCRSQASMDAVRAACLVPPTPFIVDALSYSMVDKGGDARVEQLAHHKDYTSYHEERFSLEQDRMPKPIWPLSRAALQAQATQRVASLAQPRERFKQTPVQPQQSDVTPVSPAALRYRATDRLLSLSAPKKHFEPADSPVNSPYTAVQQCNEWVAGLAGPKRLHADYIGDRELPLIVEERALTADTTARIMQLSRPFARKLLKPDPVDPFRVRPKALEATVSKRVEQLAQPKPVFKPTEKSAAANTPAAAAHN